MLQNRSYFWVGPIPTNIQPSWSWRQNPSGHSGSASWRITFIALETAVPRDWSPFKATLIPSVSLQRYKKTEINNTLHTLQGLQKVFIWSKRINCVPLHTKNVIWRQNHSASPMDNHTEKEITIEAKYRRLAHATTLHLVKRKSHLYNRTTYYYIYNIYIIYIVIKFYRIFLLWIVLRLVLHL